MHIKSHIYFINAPSKIDLLKLVTATDVSLHIFRDICYPKFFLLDKFDRQARQRCNFLQQKRG